MLWVMIAQIHTIFPVKKYFDDTEGINHSGQNICLLNFVFESGIKDFLSQQGFDACFYYHYWLKHPLKYAPDLLTVTQFSGYCSCEMLAN